MNASNFKRISKNHTQIKRCKKRYNKQASNGFQQNLDPRRCFIIITKSPDSTVLFIYDFVDTYTRKLISMSFGVPKA